MKKSILFVMAAMTIVSCSPRNRMATHENVAKSGQPIVTAIYQFKADTGAFPTNLVVLVPKYLNNLPLENWETGWTYRQPFQNNLGFSLSRFSTGYKTRVEFIYDGLKAGWVLNEEGMRTMLKTPNPKRSSNKPSGGDVQ